MFRISARLAASSRGAPAARRSEFISLDMLLQVSLRLLLLMVLGYSWRFNTITKVRFVASTLSFFSLNIPVSHAFSNTLPLIEAIIDAPASAVGHKLLVKVYDSEGRALAGARLPMEAVGQLRLQLYPVNLLVTMSEWNQNEMKVLNVIGTICDKVANKECVEPVLAKGEGLSKIVVLDENRSIRLLPFLLLQ